MRIDGQKDMLIPTFGMQCLKIRFSLKNIILACKEEIKINILCFFESP